MDRANAASHFFALLCALTLSWLMLGSMIADKKSAKRLLEFGTVTQATILRANLTVKRCRHRVTYSFKTLDGSVVRRQASFRCEREGWGPFSTRVPLPDVLEVVYDENNPSHSLLVLEARKELEQPYWYIAILFLGIWLFLYAAARRAIAWAITLP